MLAMGESFGPTFCNLYDSSTEVLRINSYNIITVYFLSSRMFHT